MISYFLRSLHDSKCRCEVAHKNCLQHAAAALKCKNLVTTVLNFNKEIEGRFKEMYGDPLQLLTLIQSLMDYLSEEIEKRDSLFKCKVSLVGSSNETHLGYPQGFI